MRRLLIAVSICVLMPAAAFATSTTISGTFMGKNSQGRPVVIKIASDRLTRSKFSWRASCVQQGSVLTGTTTLIGVLQGSKYHVTDTYTAPVAGGYKAKHTATARFTVEGHSLKGTFKLVAVVYASKGVTQTTCTTSKLTFKAKANPTVT